MNVQDGYKVTAIGVVPAGWDISKIGEISSLVTKGSTPTTYGFNFEKEGINFIKIESIDDTTGKIKIDMLAKIGNDCHTKFSRSQLKEGDILFAIAGAVGKCLIVPKEFLPANTNQALAIIRLLREVNTRYVYYQLKGPLIQNKINLIKTTTAQANISLEQVSGFEIPLPPPHEQQKIADILSTVDEHIGETGDLIEHTKTLKQGMMQRLLTKGIKHTKFKDTEIGQIPVEWEIKPLGDCVHKIIGGGTPPRDVEEYYHGDIPWFTVKDLNGSFYMEEAIEHINIESVKHSATNLIPAGSVIIATRMALGRGFINRKTIAINQDLKAIIPSEKIMPEYFLFYLLSIGKEIEAQGSGSTVKGVRLEFLTKVIIPVPSLSEQRQIASILTTIDDQIAAYQSKLEALYRLKYGLMQQLLTCRIRVKI